VIGWNKFISDKYILDVLRIYHCASEYIPGGTMRRKVIKQGHNTLTMTLPSDWVKKLNLKSGDELEISEKDNMLLVNCQTTPERRVCEIDIRNFTIPLLWRYIQSAYRAGCDDIKIIYDPSKKQYQDAYHYYTTQFEYADLGEKVPSRPANAMLQEVVNRFIGIDIMESGDGYCVVREVGEVTEKEFEHSLRRIFLVILQMFDRVRYAVEHNEIKEASLCKELHTMDLTVDKFVDYCARIMTKLSANFPEGKKSLLFSTLFILELVGDEFKYIGKHLATSKKPVKEILALLQMAREHFEMYYKLYYKFDRNQAIEFGKMDINIYKTHFKLKTEMQGESRSIMKHVMMISKFTLSLVELRIEMEFHT